MNSDQITNAHVRLAEAVQAAVEFLERTREIAPAFNKQTNDLETLLFETVDQIDINNAESFKETGDVASAQSANITLMLAISSGISQLRDEVLIYLIGRLTSPAGQ